MYMYFDFIQCMIIEKVYFYVKVAKEQWNLMPILAFVYLYTFLR